METQGLYSRIARTKSLVTLKRGGLDFTVNHLSLNTCEKKDLNRLNQDLYQNDVKSVKKEKSSS